MLTQVGLPSSVRSITFPTDASRALSFRMRSDKDTMAEVVYTIEGSPNVTFGDGSRQLVSPSVPVTPAGGAVNKQVSFRKNEGDVFQVVVRGHASESGDTSGVTV